MEEERLCEDDKLMSTMVGRVWWEREGIADVLTSRRASLRARSVSFTGPKLFKSVVSFVLLWD
jgi:hypothetical protein